MEISINPFCGRVALSRTRSLLVYLADMWLQHNLKVGLRRNKPLCGVLSRRSLIELLAIRLSPQAGKSLVMCGSLRFIPQNRLLEIS
jgi:hypothetical protein